MMNRDDIERLVQVELTRGMPLACADHVRSALSASTPTPTAPATSSAAPEVVFVGPGEDDVTRRLIMHLKPLLRSRNMTTWVTGPATGRTELLQHLDAAALIVVVLGPEMPYDLAQDLAMRKVMPVDARPYDKRSSPLRHLLATPSRGPVSSYRDQDGAFVEVVNAIRDVLERR